MLTEQGHKVLDSFRRLENLSKIRGHVELLVIVRAASHACGQARMRETHWRHLSWRSANHTLLTPSLPATG